jgi:cytoskeleton protein RodZ
MSEFGDKLRHERESRGITLDSITAATKISNRHLVALEAGHYDYLPGGIFNKCIVRSYAEVIGINPETWVNRFMSAYRESGQLKDDDANWIAFAENVGKSRNREGVLPPNLHLNWAGVTVLLVVLMALGWAFWHFVGKTSATASAMEPVSQHAGVTHGIEASAIRPATLLKIV